ncbi:hypothetical protein BH160DRAFT_1378 [Burkholderia sp. H160]|nr:hypothetical protein BH160DRAFT_1378 [Burkholderia sp. H160]
MNIFYAIVEGDPLDNGRGSSPIKSDWDRGL